MPDPGSSAVSPSYSLTTSLIHVFSPTIALLHPYYSPTPPASLLLLHPFYSPTTALLLHHYYSPTTSLLLQPYYSRTSTTSLLHPCCIPTTSPPSPFPPHTFLCVCALGVCLCDLASTCTCMPQDVSQNRLVLCVLPIGDSCRDGKLKSPSRARQKTRRRKRRKHLVQLMAQMVLKVDNRR